MPAVVPRPEQLQSLAEKKPEGSLYMLNLLKFRERAEYPDGRETDLTGAEAYGIYGAEVIQIIAGFGGEVVFAGAANVLVIGDGELEWDSVAMIRYPSFQHFVDMTRSEAYQAIHVHREAGLEHQVLVNCLGPEQAAAFAPQSAD